MQLMNESVRRSVLLRISYNKIEIWNPDDLEKIQDLSPEDFDDLADKVIL